MSKRSIQETAINYLNARLAHTATMLDRQSGADYILENLNEIRISSSFANEIGLITDDELQAVKEKWYGYKEILDSIKEE